MTTKHTKTMTWAEYEAWFRFEGAAGRLNDAVHLALQDNLAPKWVPALTRCAADVERRFTELGDARVKAIAPYADQGDGPPVTIQPGLTIKGGGEPRTPVKEITDDQYCGGE